MKKFSFIILTVVLMSCLFCFSSSALTVNNTYSDVASTASQANNLINYAMSYDNFISSDFVIFCDQQNSYYIVWSDNLYSDGDSVRGSDIEYIHYYRPSNTGASYTYVYGIDDEFSLNSGNLCTSNLPELGFRSSVFDNYLFHYQVILFCVLIGSFAFVKMIISLRGNKS